MSDPKSPKSVIPPRGLSVNDAARYVGVSRNTFMKLVRSGAVPQPLNLPEIGRVIYDRYQPDAALEARAVRHGAVA